MYADTHREIKNVGTMVVQKTSRKYIKTLLKILSY